jgi:hypothetical protein
MNVYKFVFPLRCHVAILPNHETERVGACAKARYKEQLTVVSRSEFEQQLMWTMKYVLVRTFGRNVYKNISKNFIRYA